MSAAPGRPQASSHRSPQGEGTLMSAAPGRPQASLHRSPGEAPVSPLLGASGRPSQARIASTRVHRRVSLTRKDSRCWSQPTCTKCRTILPPRKLRGWWSRNSRNGGTMKTRACCRGCSACVTTSRRRDSVRLVRRAQVIPVERDTGARGVGRHGQVVRHHEWACRVAVDRERVHLDPAGVGLAGCQADM